MKNFPEMTFSEQIHQHRRNLRLSQDALSKALGVSLRTFQRWEGGKCSPSSPRLILAFLESMKKDENNR